MKTTIFRSSSAAYRSIRQHEAKNGKTKAAVEKVGDMMYLRLVKTKKLDFATFEGTTPDVTNEAGKTFKYFPEGKNGEGYYELKAGNRRRDNSQYVETHNVYIGIHENTYTVK